MIRKALRQSKTANTQHPTHTPLLILCAATRFELETVRRDGESWDGEGAIVYQSGGLACVVSGVGIPETFAKLAEAARILNPARILNIGIAGAYPGSGLEIGDLVMAESECYGDVGFELPDEAHFQPIAQSNFGAFYANKLPMAPLTEIPAGFTLKTGAGCAVNSCAGTDRTGEIRAAYFRPILRQWKAQRWRRSGRREISPSRKSAPSAISPRSEICVPKISNWALANLRRFLRALTLPPEWPV